MTRDHASLQRQPFLMPIWLTVLTAVVVICLLGSAAWFWGTANSTMIIVVRHAEKEQTGEDPPLATAGEARAALLARMFGDVHSSERIDAIYASPTLRSRMTAAPLAARLGVTVTIAPADDARGLARRVLHEHGGGRILVVGGSDTVPDIVAALSGAKNIPAIGADEYGTMYVVSVPRIGQANLLRMNY
jgi:broad specificity phosphatase PhoE